MNDTIDKDTTDYESWAVSLCTLLDKIELASGDEDEVKKLCSQRFDIAEEHGMTVTFG